MQESAWDTMLRSDRPRLRPSHVNKSHVAVVGVQRRSEEPDTLRSTSSSLLGYARKAVAQDFEGYGSRIGVYR